MKIDIQYPCNGSDCKVIINGIAVSFTNAEQAQAYVAQLKARLEAAPRPLPDVPKRHAEPADLI
ncbi:hypothetical protein [Pseudomonas sp. PSKL.D1]|uniref:hypothetical protein n=1 Tax=Pseudomonas sp. PSKL.D1 TaxID=3029060 RepID=UPI002381900F|nr:hypothetical protein [Pseudomonas sp. PSKL.D1]WDY60479.1 hypothetical protein PVV54_12875 [Pseudomonas sp. PSKL.D1]